jgi:DNA-binding transcriptional LysR family regulator
MRLEQLKAFLAVAETGSFQQAAHQCNVTQSTVSRQIQGIESELGVALFHRSAQAKLTVAGEQFFPRARRICQEWQTAMQELSDLMAGKQPELCVAAIHSVCSSFLPPVLQQFCHDYPNVQLRVTSLGSDRALKVLRDGLVDVAIVMNNRRLTASAEMLTEKLYEEPVQVLMANDHPLAQYDQVPWSKIVHYPQVVFKDGYGMQRLVQEQFQQQGAELKAVLELNTLDAFRGVVRQGHSIALLPQSAISGVHQDMNLAVRSTDDPVLMREVVLVTTEDRLSIPPIRHFYQLVQTELRREGLVTDDGEFHTPGSDLASNDTTGYSTKRTIENRTSPMTGHNQTSNSANVTKMR